MMRSGGGGGFGDPMERDPKLAAEDVREGYGSRAVAQTVYGVVLTAAGDVYVVATKSRREGKGPVHVEEEAFEVIPGYYGRGIVHAAFSGASDRIASAMCREIGTTPSVSSSSRQLTAAQTTFRFPDTPRTAIPNFCTNERIRKWACRKERSQMQREACLGGKPCALARIMPEPAQAIMVEETPKGGTNGTH